jgi:hypothetical protein
MRLAAGACMIVLSAAAHAAAAPAFNAHDLSGIWSHPGGARDAPARLNAPRVVHPDSTWSTEKLPFTEAGRKAFEANIPTGGPRQVKGVVSTNDPRDTGNPLGLYRMLGFSGGTRVFEMGTLNGNLVQLFSVGRIFRIIYTDGRPAPEGVSGPYWYGESVGKWDGDTLVVTTASLDSRQWLDAWGTPISLEGKIEERWRRTGPDELQLSITVNDPTYYSKAWSSPPDVFRRAKKGVEPDEIIYAPVDIVGYGKEILLPSSNQAKKPE